MMWKFPTMWLWQWCLQQMLKKGKMHETLANNTCVSKYTRWQKWQINLPSPTNAPHSTDNHLHLPSFTIHHMVVIISLIREGMFTHYFEYISAIVNIILWALNLIFSHHQTFHHADVKLPCICQSTSCQTTSSQSTSCWMTEITSS